MDVQWQVSSGPIYRGAEGKVLLSYVDLSQSIAMVVRCKLTVPNSIHESMWHTDELTTLGLFPRPTHWQCAVLTFLWVLPLRVRRLLSPSCTYKPNFWERTHPWSQSLRSRNNFKIRGGSGDENGKNQPYKQTRMRFDLLRMLKSDWLTCYWLSTPGRWIDSEPAL